jgi:hypothetical protein
VPRAVVRVSRVGGRDGEQFVCPSEHAQRIRAVWADDELTIEERPSWMRRLASTEV